METVINNNQALYAYFGEFGIFSENIPGHSFYQIGLLASITETYGVGPFDVYNYMDNEFDGIAPPDKPVYPKDLIGKVIQDNSDALILNYRLKLSQVMHKIANKEYSKLFLKARFRNLSTLAKKMDDARKFETFIQYALSNGYKSEDIIVLDTDLSMSPSVTKRLMDLKITIVVPSVDFPGIGRSFLKQCMEVHRELLTTGPLFPKSNNIMFHGNLDFQNYKTGHSKNPILFEIIEMVNHEFMFDQSTFTMSVAAKDSEELRERISKMARVLVIPRQDRSAIWDTLMSSLCALDVSKDLYLHKNFIPARVYESVIAGTIPVSYMRNLHPAMSFETTSQFFEICKFLAECSRTDYYLILAKIASNL